MQRLAVVGAGIGGCSAAYFAKKYLPGVKVTVYETQDQIGGRIFTRNLAGVKLEVGATFYNQANKTIRSLVASEGLKVKRMEETLDFRPSSLSKTSVPMSMRWIFASGMNRLRRISATSTAWEMAFPRALMVQALPWLRINIAAIT